MNPVANPASIATVRPHKGTPSFLIENHDQAYYLWRDAGLSNIPLVHVDAHHDMWPIVPGGPTTVGSYVFRAMKEGIVSDVYWVVPDDSFASEENIKLLLLNIETLPEMESLRRFDGKLAGRYLGHELVVCSAAGLPIIAGEVLLDVDVDYFVLPKVSAPDKNEVPDRTPWSWPQDLWSALASKIDVRMLTVAYSVNGGTTPMKWKHLGEEFEWQWKDTHAEKLRYFELIREGQGRWLSGDAEAALESLRSAIRLEPEHPVAHWNLAELHDECERSQEARDSFARAVGLDASYGCAYNNAGPCLEAAGCWDEAAKEYQRILRLGPADPHAMCGLARVAAERNEWQQALEHSRRALETNGNIIEANRVFGDACFALLDYAGALSGYENYMRLLGPGHRSLSTAISSVDDVEDVHELAVRARMANLYRATGDTSNAEEQFLWLSKRRIPETPIASVKLQHALLLLQRGRASSSVVECASALMSLPTDAGRAVRKILRASNNQNGPETPAKNALLNAVRMAVSFMAAVATSAILARSLGPEGMGVYAYTLWIAGVIVALSHFGLPTALSKFVAEYLGAGDASGAAQVARRLLKIQILVILACMGAGAGVLFFAKSNVPWLFAVLLVAPMALQQLLTSTLMGAHDYARLSWNGAWGALAQVILTGVAAWRGASLAWFLVAMLTANVFTTCLYLWQLRSSEWWNSADADAQEKKFDSARIVRFAGPVAYLVVLDIVVWQRSELWFLHKYSVWQEIAFYSIGYLIVHRVSEILVSATSTLVPLQARNFGHEGVVGVARIHEQALCLLQVLMLPVCIGAALLSRPLILLLYGHAYERVWPILLVLLVSPVAVCITDVSVASLYALDRQKALMLPLTLTAVLNISLAFLLVPRWGAMGAAAANCAAQLAEGAFLLFFASSVLRQAVPWRRIVRIYCTATISFLPPLIVFLAGWSALLLVSVFIISGGFYFIALQVFNELGTVAFTQPTFSPQEKVHAGA